MVEPKLDLIANLSHIEPLEILLRLVAGAGLGLIVGLDREVKDKPIGARAFMLVGLGSAAFTVMTLEAAHAMSAVDGASPVDVSRVVQGVIGGIGFLGAGAIIQSGRNIRGSSTGASIWCVGGIGAACGFGFYFLAIATAALAFLALVATGALRARVDALKDNE